MRSVNITVRGCSDVWTWCVAHPGGVSGRRPKSWTWDGNDAVQRCGRRATWVCRSAVDTVTSSTRRTPCNRPRAGTAPGSAVVGSSRHGSCGPRCEESEACVTVTDMHQWQHSILLAGHGLVNFSLQTKLPALPCIVSFSRLTPLLQTSYPSYTIAHHLLVHSRDATTNPTLNINTFQNKLRDIRRRTDDRYLYSVLQWPWPLTFWP